MKIYTSSYDIERGAKEALENVVVDEAIRRYEEHLGKKGVGLGESVKWHIREELEKRVFVRIEAELKTSFKEMDKIY